LCDQEEAVVSPDSQPLISRVFDLSVLMTGLLATVATVLAGSAAYEGSNGIGWEVWLCVPVVTVFARYPVHLDRPVGSVEIGFDSCVLAFLGAAVLPSGEAVLIWAVGAIIAQFVVRRRLPARIFNIGVMITSGAAALWTMQVLAGDSGGQASLREFVAIMAGCCVYFLLDFLISEVSVALENRAPVRPQLGEAGLLSMGSIVAVDSLGYLAALIGRSLPSGAMVLFAVPLFTLLVAAKSTARDRERSRRMRVLFDVSRSVQSRSSTEEVLALLEPGARDLIRVPQTRLRDTAPTSGEVGARVTDGTRDWWLVAPEWSRLRATIASDAEHLHQLALAGSEALSRLKLTREMTYLARHDTLTQLANRNVFLDRVEHALQMARRRRSRVAVLFCDLDGFKQINDRFGHNAGDAVLVTIAGRIRGCVRTSDTVARLGGDEFAILLEDVLDPLDVDRVTTSVLTAVIEPTEVNGHFVTVTTSVGVATSDGSDTSEGILRSADIAMYEAKAQGKNCVARYQPELGSARVRKLEMVDALRAAITNGDLSVVYQPVMDVHSGAVVGLEALARWHHADRDVTPNQFVPLAEETGLVVALGEHVLEIVARDAHAIRAAPGLLGCRLDIAVNISAQQLCSPMFVEKVRATAESMHGLDLVLEVTERDVVREDSLSLEAMDRLVEAGVRFAVDDFGVGFSSIGYLQHLPVHILKTDRTFAADIDSSRRSAELLRSMLLMGQALGLDVVVEGVERPEQLDLLRRMRYHVNAQGYLLGRPMTLEHVLTMRADGTVDQPEVRPVLEAPGAAVS
jgi:diguanylate cyclase (GGDEF)-like protein